MAPPFLFLRNMTGGTAAVFRYDGATPTQIGNTFGTLESNDPNYMGKNRVVQFQNDLYCVQNLGVYKLQGDGVTWSNTVPNGGLPFTSPVGATVSFTRTGLYPISVNGEAYLICAFINTTNSLVVATMDAATNTWSETGALLSTTSDAVNLGGFLNEVVYGNKFYLGWRDNAGSIYKTASYDPVLGSASFLANVFPDTVNENMADVCIHNGRLFTGYITTTGGTGRYNLAEFTGGQWVDLGQITSTAVSPNTISAQESRISLMSDGTSLYCFFLVANGNNGFYAYEITDPDSLPGTYLGNTVIPLAILPSSDGGTGFASNDARLIHVPDTQTNPGSPDHYFYFTISATVGTAWQLYQWNGNASLMTAVGPTGGDVAHSIPTAGAAGGERIFSAVASDNDILITKRETVSGGIKCTFRGYSPSGTTSGTVRFWINLQGEPVSTQATLTTPVTGGSASLSDNTVITVVADGTTDYTVVVPAVANSFTNLSQVDLVPEFF